MFNIHSASTLITLLNTQPVILEQIRIRNTTTKIGKQIVFTSSHRITITTITVQNIPELILSISKSNVTSINKLMIENCTQAMHISDTSISSISSSTFLNNGNNQSQSGGAIYMSNSIASIHDSMFMNNTAIDGGAIQFSCASTNN